MLAISSSPSLPPEHSRWSRRQRDIVTQLAHDLTVPASKLEELAHEFCRQMGIALNPGRTRDLVLIPTFVSTRPDGSERGCRLALDLGSTNFR
ncbi:glucokinase, partial [Lunasporangiospora selenospora]